MKSLGAIIVLIQTVLTQTVVPPSCPTTITGATLPIPYGVTSTFTITAEPWYKVTTAGGTNIAGYT